MNHPNRSPDLPKLATALKAYRARKGITVETLAGEIGIPARTINEMEQAARSPKTHLASGMAWALDQLG